LVQQLSKTISGLAIPALIFIIVMPIRGILELGGKNNVVAVLIFFGCAFIIAGSFMAKPTMLAWRAWQK